MTTCVVLGSNAFSGQDFVDLLLTQTDFRVYGFSRSVERPDFLLRYAKNDQLARFSFHQFDLNTDVDAMIAFLDEIKPELIVNFAAQSEVGPSWDHPEHWFETNTVSLAKLVNHLSRVDYLQKYLHVSSPEVYGNCIGTITEESPVNPSTPYAASKAAADMLLQVYQKQFGFPLVSVRATNVYGARQQLFKIIQRAAIYVKLNRIIQLHGGGHAIKSYIHVRDVSEGELAILNHGRVGEMYHLSPDGGISVRDVVGQICSLLGKSFADCVEVVADRPGQDAAYVIDSSKARAELNWVPRISLEDGLAEVVSWVNENWSAIEKYPLDYIHKA